MRRVVVGSVLVLVLVMAGCSSAGSDEGGAGRSTTTSRAATERTTTTTEALEPLEDQTPPPTINGITVQGNTIWVASIEGDEVLQIDRQDGAILQRFDTKGAGPDDVAMAPDGSVWSTGFANGDVGRVDDGTYDVVLEMEPGINPIDIAPDGTVFIGTYGPDGELFDVETDGGEPSDRTEPRPVADGLPDVNAFAVDRDGTVTAPAGGVAGPGAIVRIDSGGEVDELVTDLPPVAAGTADADGTFYALANITGEVIRLADDGESTEVVRTVEQGKPFDNLAFAPDGTLYLSSFTAPTITEVSPDGTERVIAIGG